MTGNTRIDKERLINQKIRDIFSWGKHLVFQFDGFALRVHFLLFGTFEAYLKNEKIAGDYPREGKIPRLALQIKNGQITLYNCSVRYIEHAEVKKTYDFTIDTLSENWDPKQAFKQMQKFPDEQLGDVLFDQTIFAGVGNIIKNEVLFLVQLSPERLVRDCSSLELKQLIQTVREFVFQFYEWRKQFVLRKHYRMYRKRICPQCQQAVVKKKTGSRQRISYFCLNCQH